MVVALRAHGLRAAHAIEKATNVGGHTAKRFAPCYALQRREAVLAASAAVFLADAGSSQAGMCDFPTECHDRKSNHAIRGAHHRPDPRALVTRVPASVTHHRFQSL